MGKTKASASMFDLLMRHAQLKSSNINVGDVDVDVNFSNNTLNESSLANTNSLEVPENVDFGLQDDIPDENGVSWRPPIRDNCIHTPSTVPLPESVADAMFKPPDGFGPSYLYDRLWEDKGVKYAESMWEKLTPEEKSTISLLKILKGKDIALFDQIMHWRWKSDLVYKHKVFAQSRPPTRKSCLSKLMETYGYNWLLPDELEVALPHTGATVKVQRFSFGQMFASLLTDPVAMQPENLIINPADPFAEPAYPREDDPDQFYSDFNTGQSHKKAWERLCRGRTRRILCEISLFIDKTHLDSKGKHTLEPVLFTIGLFKRNF
jgi:hypothetical protein